MTRLPPLSRPQLNEGQAALWELLRVGGPADNRLDDEGGLTGPSNALLRIPELATTMLAYTSYFYNGTVLERRLIELAICIVASHTRADFAFWRHSAAAVSHGVDAQIVDHLRQGRRPHFDVDDERIVHDVISQLLRLSEVDELTYKAAIECFSERGLVELISAVGFYSTMTMLVNVFEMAVPDHTSIFNRGATKTGPLQDTADSSTANRKPRKVSMNYVGCWVHIPLKPGTRAAAAQVAEFALDKINQEDGAILFALNASDNDPDALLLVEIYRDEEALQTHQNADWLAGYTESLMPFVAGEPNVHVIRPLIAKGL